MGFLHTLHSAEKRDDSIRGKSAPVKNLQWMVSCWQAGSTTWECFLPAMLPPCWLPCCWLSLPPNNGPRCAKDTCSIKDMPYFRKYHHSNICKKNVESEFCMHKRLNKPLEECRITASRQLFDFISDHSCCLPLWIYRAAEIMQFWLIFHGRSCGSPSKLMWSMVARCRQLSTKI